MTDIDYRISVIQVISVSMFAADPIRYVVSNFIGTNQLMITQVLIILLLLIILISFLVVKIF